jgi:DNA polymerase (family X)
VRLAIEGGARIVVNTDAHSTNGLGNMPLAVHTARRGWATPADVINVRPLEELLRLA